MACFAVTESRNIPMSSTVFVPLEHTPVDAAEMRRRAEAFYAEVRGRRSVRHFSDRPVPREVIENCLLAAGTAPSGANQQPWHFVVVGDRRVKRRIREAAQREEREFYDHRVRQLWLDVLAPLGTGPSKPFLEIAPYLIAVFVEQFGLEPDGTRTKRYYPGTSASIATGILLTGLHRAGLVALTYTPYRMGFLNEILHRPKNERPLMIVVTGYPADDATVPRLGKKALDQIATFL